MTMRLIITINRPGDPAMLCRSIDRNGSALSRLLLHPLRLATLLTRLIACSGVATGWSLTRALLTTAVTMRLVNCPQGSALLRYSINRNGTAWLLLQSLSTSTLLLRRIIGTDRSTVATKSSRQLSQQLVFYAFVSGLSSCW